MFTSVSKKVHEIVLNELNNNTQGAKFEGNYIFKFWTQPSAKYQEFHIIKTSDTLEYEAEEVAPFVDVSFTEIPFNEKNKRSDMQVEYYVAIRVDMERDENGKANIQFDTSNKFYQAMLETVENMREQLTYTGENFQITFKLTEPQKVNVFKYATNYYQLFALTFTATKIEHGRFGNQFKLSIGETEETLTELDMVETTVIMSKVPHDKTKTTEKDRKEEIQTRTFEIQGLCNFRGFDVDKLLMNEVLITQEVDTENDKEYYIRLYQEGDFDILRQVKVHSGNMIFRNNKVEQITFTLKR